MSFVVDVPEVRDVMLLEIRVNVLGDPDEPRWRAAC
jgi:hypothetical protein